MHASPNSKRILVGTGSVKEGDLNIMHDASLCAVFQMGLDENTIRCSFPVCDFSLIELINLILYLNGSNIEIEEERKNEFQSRPVPSESHVTLSAHLMPRSSTCRTTDHNHPSKIFCGYTANLGTKLADPAITSVRAALKSASRPLKPAHVTSAKPKPTHTTSATPGPVYITSATPGPAHVKPAAPGPAHVKPAAPGPAHVKPAFSEPVHKMAAQPEHPAERVAQPEQPTGKAISPESSSLIMARSAVHESSQVRAV
ncbi:hypothetical protein M9458_006131, partial [Cirrhinus mrigala]